MFDLLELIYQKIEIFSFYIWIWEEEIITSHAQFFNRYEENNIKQETKFSKTPDNLQDQSINAGKFEHTNFIYIIKSKQKKEEQRKTIPNSKNCKIPGNQTIICKAKKGEEEEKKEVIN